MPNVSSLCSTRVHRTAVRCFTLVALTSTAVALPLSAQGLWRRSHPPQWSLLLVGGGAYSLSDLEIVPGRDQNGGWTWDAGLRLQKGRGAFAVGFERTRYDLGGFGATTPSGIYVEPRFALATRGIGLTPYVFAHGTWIYDYNADVCCSVYPVNQDADGWSLGGGFGLTTPPVGFVRFDLSASVSKLSAESDAVNFGSWKGAGPVIAVRLGASVPLLGTP